MTQVELQEHARGVVLPVYAQPGAKRSGVTGVHLQQLRIAVSAAPEQGKANRALIELIAQTLGLHRREVIQLSGETHREKRFLLEGQTRPEIASRLEALGW
jgi:uncharacterized protein